MSTLIKYPRTYHVPWSPGVSTDDKVQHDLSYFEGQNVVVTVKMDGENTTMYHDHIHARSLDTKSHPSRDWIKQFHASIRHDIPTTLRVCGENLYAQHSIRYNSLESYFLCFSIWEGPTCLDWSDTVEWCELLGIRTVPVLYQGLWNVDTIKGLQGQLGGNEGYVVRPLNSFTQDQFQRCVVKYVRANHVQTNTHWMHKEVVPNTLIS